jgi:hypothetical protein
MNEPMEVSFVEEVALRSAAPAPAAAPAPSLAPDLGPPKRQRPNPLLRNRCRRSHEPSRFHRHPSRSRCPRRLRPSLTHCPRRSCRRRPRPSRFCRGQQPPARKAAPVAAKQRPPRPTASPSPAKAGSDAARSGQRRPANTAAATAGQCPKGRAKRSGRAAPGSTATPEGARCRSTPAKGSFSGAGAAISRSSSPAINLQRSAAIQPCAYRQVDPGPGANQIQVRR